MSIEPDKQKQVRIFNRTTGEVRLSEPMPVHGQHSIPPAAAAAMSTSETTTVFPPTPLAETAGAASRPSGARPTNSPAVGQSAEPLDSTPSSDVAVGDASTSDLGQKAGVVIKPKAEIESLEQFIAYAYSRKGQRVTLKPKTERFIAQSPRLDDAAINRLEALTEADVLLAVPRQLLLVSREVGGLPELRAALDSFVSAVMLRHPIFANDRVQSAVRNLPDAPPMVDVLMTVATYVPAEVEGKDRLKPSDLQALRRSAVNLLITWFACNRGLNFEEMASLLFQVLWAPAARDLADDDARLRALTEVEQSAGVGLACQRFRQQITEARSVQDQAQREATALRQQVAELDEQFQREQAERKALASEIEALRTSSTNKIAELHTQHKAEQMHLRHELEQLRGRLVRRLDDSIEMLEVGLTALRNKTPRTEVMAERAEHVVDALRAESTNLREN